MLHRSIGAIASVLVWACGLSAVAHAQTYPARTVTIVVPNAAGGGTDTIARLIADQLSKQMGQSFVVENKTGAGMVLGTVAVAKAAPDGYTLLTGLNGNLTVNPSLYAKLPYDAVADFRPIAMLAEYPFLVIVNNDLPVKSIKDLAAYLKANPGKVDYASAGNGTGQHLARRAFQDDDRHGDEPRRLSWRAAGLSGRDLRPGAGVLRQHVHRDESRPGRQGAGAGDHLEDALVADAGHSDRRRGRAPRLRIPYLVWSLGAEGHAVRHRRKLHAEVTKALADPTIQQRIVATAGAPSHMELAAIDPFVKAEIEKWAEVVKRAGIKVE